MGKVSKGPCHIRFLGIFSMCHIQSNPTCVCQLSLKIPEICFIQCFQLFGCRDMWQEHFGLFQSQQWTWTNWFWYNRFTHSLLFNRLLCRQETSLKYQLSPIKSLFVFTDHLAKYDKKFHVSDVLTALL